MTKHFNAVFKNPMMTPNFEQATDKRIAKFKGNNIMKEYLYMKPKLNQGK